MCHDDICVCYINLGEHFYTATLLGLNSRLITLMIAQTLHIKEVALALTMMKKSNI